MSAPLLPDWPRAWGAALASGELKRNPEDFEVEEQLDIALDGAGEHLWIWLEKRNRNTVDVVRELAVAAGVRERDVSWSGLKDRVALTRQWFSIQLPRRDDAERWDGEGWKVLSAGRHGRKLRTGTHRSNRFRLVLRDVTGDRRDIEQRLQLIDDRGVPNYFGPQRFGRRGRNMEAVRRWFASGRPRLGRQRRSLLLSSARAWLFNQVLASRVADGSWQRAVPGEVMILNGRGSVFPVDPADDPAELEARLAMGEIHPTGPLFGAEAGVLPTAEAARLERTICEAEADLCAGLVAAGAAAARRSLRLRPQQLFWQWRGDDLELGFVLPAGSFATVLVAELVDTIAPAEPAPDHSVLAPFAAPDG